MAEKIKSFVNLVTWQEAHKLVLAVYETTENFPKRELFSLTNQMRRAAISVTSNIAEGFSRQSKKDKNNFYSMAQASLIELQNQLIISRDLKYIDNKKFKELINQTIIVNKLINGFKRSSVSKNFNTRY